MLYKHTAHSGGSLWARGTCEGHAHVVVQGTDLPHGPFILKLGDGFLFYPEHDYIAATNPNLSSH